MTYKKYITQLTVMPETESLFSDCAIRIEIDDEGAGCFVVLKQTECGAVKIDVTEWDAIREAIDEMIATALLINAKAG